MESDEIRVFRPIKHEHVPFKMLSLSISREFNKSRAYYYLYLLGYSTLNKTNKNGLKGI